MFAEILKGLESSCRRVENEGTEKSTIVERSEQCARLSYCASPDLFYASFYLLVLQPDGADRLNWCSLRHV